MFWRRCMGGWRAMLCSVFIRTKATCAKRCWESPPMKGPQKETCGFCCQSAVEQMCFLGWCHEDIRSVVHLVHARETERQTTGCCQLLYKEVRRLGALASHSCSVSFPRAILHTRIVRECRALTANFWQYDSGRTSAWLCKAKRVHWICLEDTA